MAHIEVPRPGASEIVTRLLTEALSEHPDVRWLGLSSEDGFAIASEGSVSVDDDAVAAGAVRLMIQARAVSKALGQSGTSQMFLEGEQSGICVIDKDPWVLVVVGAPGVPIGLLRYEAREIAESFPVGQRPALAATHGEQPVEWSTVGPGDVGGYTEADVDVDEPPIVPETDLGLGEPPIVPEASAVPTGDSPDQSDRQTTVDVQKAGFDLPPPTTHEATPFGMPPVADLADLAPPVGPPIDLPPPAGPVFDLPPPV